MSRTPAGLMIQKMADIHIVEFMESSVLDQVRIEQIRNELDAIVDKAGVPKILLSFDGVAHISSALLGVLMSIDKKCKAKKGEIRLAHINDSIFTVFKMTKLDKVLKIYKNVEAAMGKF